MWNMLWPILIVIGSNTVYNIAAKSTSETVDPFASLSVTYLTGAIVSALLFLITSKERSIVAEVSKMNWASIVLGVAIVGLEFGFIQAYRVGWKISIAQLVTSIGVSCVLILVGLLIYQETVSLRQWIGIAVCACGLILIAK